MHSAELPPLRHLLRHSGSVLLLDKLIDHDAEQTTALVDTSEQVWLKGEDGQIGAWVTIEYMAQCVAAHEGLRAHIENRSLPRGLLIGVYNLRLQVPRFLGSQRLWVTSRRARGRPGLGVLSHACSIHEEGNSDEATLLATGRISVSVQSASRPRPVPLDAG